MLINKRNPVMDSRGHYSRPELFSLLIDRRPTAHMHDRAAEPGPGAELGQDNLRVVVA